MKITEAMVAEMAHHLTNVNQNDFYGALKAAIAAAPTHTEICKNEMCPRGGRRIEVLD